jgi:hypothetical protein
MQHPCHSSKQERQQSHTKTQRHKGLGLSQLLMLLFVPLCVCEGSRFRFFSFKLGRRCLSLRQLKNGRKKAHKTQKKEETPGGEPLLTAARLLARSREKIWHDPTLCSRRLPGTSPRVNSARCRIVRTNENAAGRGDIRGRSREPPANTCLLLPNATFQRHAFNLGRSKAAPLQVSLLSSAPFYRLFP